MAVQHIVWLKPNDGVSDELVAELLSDVQALNGQVPGIIAISSGKNFTDRAIGFTHGIIVTLSDPDALPAYIDHPLHQAVGAKLKANCAVMAMDYEY